MHVRSVRHGSPAACTTKAIRDHADRRSTCAAHLHRLPAPTAPNLYHRWRAGLPTCCRPFAARPTAVWGAENRATDGALFHGNQPVFLIEEQRIILCCVHDRISLQGGVHEKCLKPIPDIVKALRAGRAPWPSIFELISVRITYGCLWRRDLGLVDKIFLVLSIGRKFRHYTDLDWRPNSGWLPERYIRRDRA